MPYVPVDRGPMGGVENRLQEILLELYALNLGIRDLLLREQAAPSVSVEAPSVDLSPLLEALGRDGQDPTPLVNLDLQPLLAEIANMRASDGAIDTAIVEGLKDLKKQLSDFGERMTHIAGSGFTGGGGAVYLSKDSQVTLAPGSHVTVDSGTVTAQLAAGTADIGNVVVSNFPATQPVSGTVSVTGVATEATLLNVKRAISDFETRLDYDVRTDGNPVYVGKQAQGTATSASTWIIQKLTYDASARLTRTQVLTGSWDNRASLGWT